MKKLFLLAMTTVLAFHLQVAHAEEQTKSTSPTGEEECVIKDEG